MMTVFSFSSELFPSSLEVNALEYDVQSFIRSSGRHDEQGGISLSQRGTNAVMAAPSFSTTQNEAMKVVKNKMDD